MRPLVVPLTLVFLAIGCDGRAESAHIVEGTSPALAGDMVDGLLSFDAGMLAQQTSSWTAVSAGTSANTEQHDKGFEPAAPVAPGIPLSPSPRTGECEGDVSACNTRGITACLLGEGCVRARGCVGARAECASAAMNSDTCARAGCTWAEHCEGEATPCSLLPEDDCVVQPGCGFITR